MVYNRIRCRSPPSNLDFQKIQIGGKKMKGKHPKRRRDKYNPYHICEKDGNYYIAFQDGQGVTYEGEIDKSLYDAFDRFELEDLSYLNIWDRHMEQSEIWDTFLTKRATKQPDSVEDIVFRNLQIEKLHSAISKLPEMQKHRLILHYFEGLTYEQIAKEEGCSKVAVKYSVDKAVKKLKEILE